jgi:hypothetical protein
MVLNAVSSSTMSSWAAPEPLVLGPDPRELRIARIRDLPCLPKYRQAPFELLGQVLVGAGTVTLGVEASTSAELIDRRRRSHDTAVVFVTHEINPILHLADRVLYLTGGRFRIRTPAEVMTSTVLSELYGTPIEVISVHERLTIIGAADHEEHLPGNLIS